MCAFNGEVGYFHCLKKKRMKASYQNGIRSLEPKKFHIKVLKGRDYCSSTASCYTSLTLLTSLRAVVNAMPLEPWKDGSLKLGAGEHGDPPTCEQKHADNVSTSEEGYMKKWKILTRT